MQTSSSDAHPRERAEATDSYRAVLLIALLALLVRSPGITRPLVGAFATKNAVYAMIARNHARGVATFDDPQLDCLVGGGRGRHLLEVPVSAYLAGQLWRHCGGRLDVWGRSVSILCSVLAVLLMWLLVSRWHGQRAGLAAAVMMALSPVGVIYGQSFMLESSVVLLTLATLLWWDRWLSREGALYTALAGVTLALLLLTKIYMAMLLLPLAVMAVRSRWNVPWEEGRSRRELSPLALDAVLIAAACLPAGLWVGSVISLASGGEVASQLYYSLGSSAAVHGFPHPLLKSPAFLGQILDDVSGVVLTPIGLGLALLALLHPAVRRHWPLFVSGAVLLIALPAKFYRMNYYWVVLLPGLCLLVGLGWDVVCQRLRPTRKMVAFIMAAAMLFSLRYAVGPAFRTPTEDQSVLAAAQAAQDFTRPNEPLATLHGSTLDLLYYTDRRGWALSAGDKKLAQTLQACRDEGARYLVVAGWNQLRKSVREELEQWPIVAQDDDYRIMAIQPLNSDAAVQSERLAN